MSDIDDFRKHIDKIVKKEKNPIRELYKIYTNNVYRANLCLQNMIEAQECFHKNKSLSNSALFKLKGLIFKREYEEVLYVLTSQRRNFDMENEYLDESVQKLKYIEPILVSMGVTLTPYLKRDRLAWRVHIIEGDLKKELGVQ